MTFEPDVLIFLGNRLSRSKKPGWECDSGIAWETKQVVDDVDIFGIFFDGTFAGRLRELL